MDVFWAAWQVLKNYAGPGRMDIEIRVCDPP